MLLFTHMYCSMMSEFRYEYKRRKLLKILSVKVKRRKRIFKLLFARFIQFMLYVLLGLLNFSAPLTVLCSFAELQFFCKFQNNSLVVYTVYSIRTLERELCTVVFFPFDCDL
jgi:hypothetical protein